MKKNDTKTISELLRNRGISPTSQRIKIAHVLFSCMTHLSADQILAAVNSKKAEVSKATVYNTLGLFLKKGLLKEVIVDPTKILYDPNTTDHHHFYDIITGELSDIDASVVSIPELPPLPNNRIFDGVDIIIRTRPATA
ncbi:MAG: transcriptional repressor [Legionella sp. 21-45-4]|nr:MAG: transcriptional repressor [Legionella sp. 21-45-4]HQT26543.1 transcriptional repressor [Burkholderiales bacterium]